MQKIQYLIALITISISCTSSATQEQKSYLISPQEFSELMSKDNVVVLDVRTPGEVAEGVIGDAKVINFQDDDFEEKVKVLGKSKTYLVYCKGGGRSGRTKALMDASGFDEVYDLRGGITAWNSAGLPTK